MAISDELSAFVKESLARGLPPAQIEDALRRAGWPEEQIRGGLAGFAPIDFPVPVPRPKPYLSARDAFLYLVLFAMLYASAYHLAQLFFQIIDRAFPDPADPAGEYTRQAVRWSVSSLIVTFPVLLYMSALTGRDVRADPNKRESKVRRWLTYLTLFVAAGFLVGDFITLVYNLLGGELTTRFMLKAATVAILAGTTFGYYLSEKRPLAIFGIVLVIAGIAGGLMILRSPAEERVNRLDRRRVEDLQQIERAVNLHWTRQGRLPATLDEVSRDAGIRISANDPVTGEPYGYRPLDDKKFEVCAVFETVEPRDVQISSFWSHGAGRQCFQPTAREIPPS